MSDPKRPIRDPAVAGTFYPDHSETLSTLVDRLLEEAASRLEPDRRLRALVCPHAGYEFSGHIAAEAFSCLKGRDLATVVLVGPDHYVGFEGIAIYPKGAFRTPLGDVWVDEELAELFLGMGPEVMAAPEAHRREHALEVQLPFLQRTLPEARIVPILMGFRSRTNVEVLANALSRALDNSKVVLVASTDLSHYHPRAVAHKLDRRITELVRSFAPASLWEELRAGRVEACGGDALVSVMLAAAISGAETSRVLRYGDSGDSNQDSGSVVGYLSAAFFQGPPPAKVEFEAHARELAPAETDALLHLAHRAAGTGLSSPLPVLELHTITPRLLAPGRAFVTLRKGSELRGCIGYVDVALPLWEAVARAARGAAAEDPRFDPVTPGEFADLTVEVSILSPPWTVEDPDTIVPGRHGLIVSRDPYRGLLLPQIAVEQGWDRETFLAQVCRKAGLPPDAWRTGARIEAFTAQVFQGRPGPLAVNGGA